MANTSGRSVAFTQFEWEKDSAYALLDSPEVREFVQQKTNEVRDNVLRTAPKYTGNYLENVEVSVLPNKKGRPIGQVRVRARHAHLVEFGTGPRFTSSGKSTGSMPPQHIIGKAVRAAGLKLSASYRDQGRELPGS